MGKERKYAYKTALLTLLHGKDETGQFQEGVHELSHGAAAEYVCAFFRENGITLAFFSSHAVMPYSDWSASDGDVSDNDEASSAMNILFVEHLARQHPPRVTQRRRSRSPSKPGAENGTKREVAVPGVTPRKHPRFDLAAMIRDALKKGDESLLPAEVSVEQLAAQIMGALRKSSCGGEVARAVTHALADPLNVDLRNAVLQGKLSPGKLVLLDEISLLNPEDRAVQEKARQDRLNQHSVEYLERLSLTVTHIFTCPACGSHECYANFRSTDFVKWQGDDQTPTLLRCCKCSHSFRQ